MLRKWHSLHRCCSFKWTGRKSNVILVSVFWLFQTRKELTVSVRLSDSATRLHLPQTPPRSAASPGPFYPFALDSASPFHPDSTLEESDVVRKVTDLCVMGDAFVCVLSISHCIFNKQRQKKTNGDWVLERMGTQSAKMNSQSSGRPVTSLGCHRVMWTQGV